MWRNSFCEFGTFWGSGPWFMGGIFHLLFGLLILLLMIGLLKKIFAPSKEKQKEDALDILKRRYAAGEIDQKHFEEVKSTLE